MDSIVHIPTNYTDTGKILGMFEIRNTVECLALCIPIALFILFLSPFGLSATVIICTVVIVPIGGFTLIGVYDDSLITFLRVYFRWKKHRRILTYRGSTWIKEIKKSRNGR